MRRQAHPKVCTGCLTCENRRVEYDEAKPARGWCSKVGLDCDGYVDPSQKNKKFYRLYPSSLQYL
ncbi:uncharacterized protein K444DRAFT_530436 [Hyaloscypha bicolor E]|uniref:Zn(2)-C6 fungal-type domain-containing protein n=1 Tax=Hyaloscypha bicolor E TaxID=1095630 RepID=A0A2J6T756_9HELO|nr:uncharacterized protein K444DRAFT_530436 [Hyaloscypha bicolor E]PMD58838.1 hypothetical protein K444DRAFT_530436 [Hyaloscypha bicolor E]